jgi:hypothetical protein
MNDRIGALGEFSRRSQITEIGCDALFTGSPPRPTSTTN